jgi:hypothetical protein
MRRILSVLCLLMLTLLLILPSSEGFAQKKKSTKEETTTVQTTPKSGGTFKEWLGQHVGLPTNHGTLQKISADYVVFDDEGVETIVPISMLLSVTVKKEKEDEEKPEKITLMIKFVSAE